MQQATTFEQGGKVYEVRAIATLNGWKVRIFIEGIPANGFTYSVDSEVYQDAPIDGVPEDLVAGLMETAERDFRRGLAQELVAAEKATDDDIAAEIDKFKPRERPGQQVVGAVARDPEAQADAAGPPIGGRSWTEKYSTVVAST